MLAMNSGIFAPRITYVEPLSPAERTEAFHFQFLGYRVEVIQSQTHAMIDASSAETVGETAPGERQ